MLFSPKNNKTKMLKRNKNIFFIFWARQGLTLVLRILIQNEKSRLRSSLRKLFGEWFDFLEVNLTRTVLAPTYLTVENQGSRSSYKRCSCLKILTFFVFFEILYILFGIFELVENMCYTTWTVGQTPKGKENYFLVFLENKCHTVQATRETQ